MNERMNECMNVCMNESRNESMDLFVKEPKKHHEVMIG